MDIKQLRYFLSIAELESFNRAALVLRVAQPALTRQIQHLEAELGVKLLSRHARGVHLTAAGRLLRERALETIRQLDEIRHDLKGAATDASGDFHLGMPPSLRHVVTVPLIKAFAKECPSAFLKLTEATSMVLNDAILSGDMDLAIVGNLEPSITAKSVPLVRERLLLVGPPDSDLDVDRMIDVDQLTNVPLILTSQPNTLRMILENAMNKVGLSPRVVMEADHFPILIELINSGLGYGVVPYSACSDALLSGTIRGAPLKNLFVTWTLIYPRDRAISITVTRVRSLLNDVVSTAVGDDRWLHASVLIPPNCCTRRQNAEAGNQSRVDPVRGSIASTRKIFSHNRPNLS